MDKNSSAISVVCVNGVNHRCRAGLCFSSVPVVIAKPTAAQMESLNADKLLVVTKA